MYATLHHQQQQQYMTTTTQLGLTVRTSQFAKQLCSDESQKRKKVAIHAILLIRGSLYFYNQTNKFKLKIILIVQLSS